jgi:hypothetical protein
MNLTHQAFSRYQRNFIKHEVNKLKILDKFVKKQQKLTYIVKNLYIHLVRKNVYDP